MPDADLQNRDHVSVWSRFYFKLGINLLSNSAWEASVWRLWQPELLKCLGGDFDVVARLLADVPQALAFAPVLTPLMHALNDRDPSAFEKILGVLRSRRDTDERPAAATAWRSVSEARLRGGAKELRGPAALSGRAAVMSLFRGSGTPEDSRRPATLNKAYRRARDDTRSVFVTGAISDCVDHADVSDRLFSGLAPWTSVPKPVIGAQDGLDALPRAKVARKSKRPRAR